MKIYTKTGDQGKTHIYADKPTRLSKNSKVLDCYGTLDELNAHIGLLVSYPLPEKADTQSLTEIQQALFQIGFALSATSKLSDKDVNRLETQIDSMQGVLEPQTSFILPGGCTAAAQAHVCRTVARRAERNMVALAETHPVPAVCMRFLNRLSDYFFVLARAYNQAAGVGDIKV